MYEVDDPAITAEISPFFRKIKQAILGLETRNDPTTGAYTLVDEYVAKDKRHCILLIQLADRVWKVKILLPVSSKYQGTLLTARNPSPEGTIVTVTGDTRIDDGYANWRTEIDRLTQLLRQVGAPSVIEKNKVIKKILNFWLKTRGAMFRIFRQEPAIQVSQSRRETVPGSDPYVTPDPNPSPPHSSPEYSSEVSPNTPRSRTLTIIFHWKEHSDNPKERKSEHYRRLISQKKRRLARALAGTSPTTRRRRQNREERRREKRRTRRR